MSGVRVNKNLMEQENTPNGSVGPIIGTIIILAVIVIGGLYFWSQRKTDNSLINEDRINKAVESINTQSNSDSSDSNGADLESTNTEDLDAELNDI